VPTGRIKTADVPIGFGGRGARSAFAYRADSLLGIDRLKHVLAKWVRFADKDMRQL
jgi:hypothetical protein